MLRCGTGSNIELFEYTSPNQDTRLARNSDFSGHHLAFYVEDIDVAVAYMESKGVRKLLGPFPVTGGPAAGQSINYFQAPFGTYVELISYPNGMAYEATAKRKLWSAHDIGAKAIDRGIPGLLGLDHVGITVPDIKLARRWLQKNLGGEAPLRFGPISDPTGTLMTDLVDVDPRAVIEEINVVRVAERLQHRALPVLRARPGHALRGQLELRGTPPRVLRRRHRQGRGQARSPPRRAQAARPAARHRRAGRRAVDQLLRHAVRHVRRAHLLSARHGVREDRGREALEPEGRAAGVATSITSRFQESRARSGITRRRPTTQENSDEAADHRRDPGTGDVRRPPPPQPRERGLTSTESPARRGTARHTYPSRRPRRGNAAE